MCFFGSSQPAAPPRPEFDDSPPVVTGSQTGVENPIDTAKATEELKIKRQKREGSYNPGESLKIAGVTKSGGGNKTAQQKANLAANKRKAKNSALARKKNKSFSNRAKGV